jgi:hypothetical protein
VAGQKRTANVEQGAGLLSSLIGIETLFCWREKEYTEFPIFFFPSFFGYDVYLLQI